jgi:hypothetical protein
MTRTPTKRSPDGFVAQRFAQDSNGHGHWLVARIGPGGLEVEALNDEQVADWLPLVDEPIDGAAQ